MRWWLVGLLAGCVLRVSEPTGGSDVSDGSDLTDATDSTDATDDTDDSDCGDDDPETYKGAYDRPDDGIDQDCDGEDRHFDGIVLDWATSAKTTLVFQFEPVASMDVAILLDSSGGATSHLTAYLDIEGRDAALGIPDAHWGVAGFVDYPFGSMGGGLDRPFYLRQPMIDDPAQASRSLQGIASSGGADGIESGLEGIRQALAGIGYDLDCNGAQDTLDVPAFSPHPTDAFAGTGGSAWGGTTAGDLGGMGFRERSVKVLFYSTDAFMRDREAGDPTPGGCPNDAGLSDVVAAAEALDATLVGSMAFGDHWGISTQQVAIAEATGSMLDLDGDGTPDPLVIDLEFGKVSQAEMRTRFDRVLAAIAADSGADGVHDGVTARITDPDGFVDELGPVPDPVRLRPDPRVELELSVTTRLAPTDAIQWRTITVELIRDGRTLATAFVAIEIPPI